MLFCDIMVNGTPLWYGVPCLNGVDINSASYLGFVGHLAFEDMQGVSDPSYTGLGSRFVLIYFVDGTTPNVQVPLQAVPSQQQNIILNNQNCVLSIYEKDVSQWSSL